MAEEKEFDELWVASIDRLAKDMDVVGYIRTLLRRQGIKVVSLDDSVEKAFNGPKDASDEMELDKYQQKRKDGVDRAIKEHRTLQRPPFGYISVDKKLVIDERYRGLIKELFKDFENQNMSIKKLSLKYRLAPSLIQRIRSNPIYTTGEVKWQGKIVYHVEPIVKGESDEEGET
jgi:DNA invertase Pin-like site-specific DNA recombinase